MSYISYYSINELVIYLPTCSCEDKKGMVVCVFTSTSEAACREVCKWGAAERTHRSIPFLPLLLFFLLATVLIDYCFSPSLASSKMTFSAPFLVGISVRLINIPSKFSTVFCGHCFPNIQRNCPQKSVVFFFFMPIHQVLPSPQGHFNSFPFLSFREDPSTWPREALFLGTVGDVGDTEAGQSWLLHLASTSNSVQQLGRQESAYKVSKMKGKGKAHKKAEMYWEKQAHWSLGWGERKRPVHPPCWVGGGDTRQ